MENQPEQTQNEEKPKQFRWKFSSMPKEIQEVVKWSKVSMAIAVTSLVLSLLGLAISIYSICR